MTLPTGLAASWDPDAAGPCEAGIDAIEPARVAALAARWGERFLGRVFTPAERAACGERPTGLAARFAAKEAVAKALGTGLGPVAWREIEIGANPRGKPVLILHGAAATRAAALGLRHWSVSLTHLAGLALAVVVATKGDERRAPAPSGPAPSRVLGVLGTSDEQSAVSHQESVDC